MRRRIMAETNQERRGFLRIAIGLGGVAVAALMAVPGVALVLDPLIRRRPRHDAWRDIGDTGSLRDDQPVALPVIGDRVDAWTRAPEQQLGTVWLRKKEDGLEAFTAECPHLGCRIGYDRDTEKFFCPCHESAFGLDGSVISGPSPRPMDRLEARVREGKIEVRFRKYRTAVEEQEEIG
jgi:menaquinol-cytochrome c reductase iron-sulfur subunit